ncbi:MAG: hypothetical protein WDZ35_01255 [Crocinitomicaceae bacterium]
MLKKAIPFFVYSNLWISTGAACMAWLYYQLENLPIHLYLLFFLFFSTLLTYTFQRYIKLYQKEPIHGPRVEWMKQHPQLVKLFLFVGAIGTLIFLPFLSWKSMLVLPLLGLLSFLYAFKFRWNKRRTNLRDLSGIKILLIAAVWAVSCSVLPAIESGNFNLSSFSITAGFFSYIIGITIPFDIRDIKVDEAEKKTIPQLFGVPFAKIIACSLIVFSYFIWAGNFEPDYGLMIGMLLSVVLIGLSKPNRGELFFSFFIDGALIIVPVLYYLLNTL